MYREVRTGVGASFVMAEMGILFGKQAETEALI